MRFFKFLAASASLLAGLVSAQNPLAISAPAPGTDVAAGSTVTITWDADTATQVTLTLRYGAASNLAAGTVIGTVPNTGTYAWTVPADVVNSQAYSIEIADADGGTNSNFSPFFAISGGTGTAPASAVSSAATAAATSAATAASSAMTAVSSNTSVPTLMTTAKSTTKATKASTSGSAATATAADSSSSNMAMPTMPGSIAAVVGLGALVMLA